MSISDIATTMERIAFATEDSPLAVFRCNIPGRVNAMFANSIRVQERIQNKDPRLIGVYHGMMKRSHVLQELLNAIHGPDPVVPHVSTKTMRNAINNAAFMETIPSGPQVEIKLVDIPVFVKR